MYDKDTRIGRIQQSLSSSDEPENRPQTISIVPVAHSWGREEQRLESANEKQQSEAAVVAIRLWQAVQNLYCQSANTELAVEWLVFDGAWLDPSTLGSTSIFPSSLSPSSL